MSPDRAALITGGSSGIGLAIARMLGEEGYALTVSARDTEKLDAATRELRGLAPRVLGVVADMGREDDVASLFERHREAYARLDVLVNNAGTGIRAPMDAIETGDMDRQLAVNLRGVILSTREGLPLLRKAGAEHGNALIVNTASLAGKMGLIPRLAIYAATKSAVINFTKSTGQEVGGAGIQCTVLIPALVDTPMVGSVKVPAEEMIRSEDLAEGVRFLLRTSPRCHVPEIVFARPAGASMAKEESRRG